jgi:hypothetical protein
MRKSWQQAREDIDLELEKIYGDDLNLEETFGSYENRKKIVNTYREMLRGVGDGLAQSFSELMASLPINEQQQFLETYQDVNWSSSISGAAALKEMLESSNEQLKTFAENALKSESKAYSAIS